MHVKMESPKKSLSSAHDFIDLLFLDLLPHYKKPVRESQVELSHQMLDAMVGRQIALCEAGVGIGKTFSYIIAAIAFHLYVPVEYPILMTYSHLNDFSYHTPLSIVISTSSIALQQAIVDEYIPFLSHILLENRLIKSPLQAVLRKGKGNYVCETRLIRHLENKNLSHQNPTEKDALIRLRVGNIDLGLTENVSDYDRRHICVSGSCGKNCPLQFACRYSHHLMAAKSPAILFQVCNHNYLLADQMHRQCGKSPLLSNFKAVIIDEAHKLSEAARQMYGESLELPELDEIVKSAMLINTLSKDCMIRLNKLLDHSHQLFTHLDQVIQSTDEENLNSIDFDPTHETLCIMQSVINDLQQIDSFLLHSYSKNLKHQIAKLIEKIRIFQFRKDAYVYCIRKNERENRLSLEAMPYDVSQHLSSDLWNSQVPYILTSGTLAIRGDFQRTKNVLGLQTGAGSRRLRTSSVPSSFDYENNCLLYLPAEIPLPDLDSSEYLAGITDQIQKLVLATHGHTLVLFNSYRLMGKVRDTLQSDALPFPILVGDKDLQMVIQKFKTSPNAVLFATGACWEGMDFPGDMVSSLIIVTLPFSVPDQIRRQEQLKYPTLTDYILSSVVPDMQQKLRQGFGRAIRTETDTCVISILDARGIQGGRYYHHVLDALPAMPVTDRIEIVSEFVRTVKEPSYFS